MPLTPRKGAKAAAVTVREGWAVGEEHELRWEVAEGLEVVWSVRLLPSRRLLLRLSPGALPDGSKEAFVRLLEWAEEELGAEEVALELSKDRRDLQPLLRTFAYFGFALLPPDKAKLVSQAPNSLVMTYEI